MNFKHVTLLAAALTASAPAWSISVNLTDFTFGPRNVLFQDTGTGVTVGGPAGQFSGTIDTSSSTPVLATAQGLTANAQPFAATSFTAYCAEITQSIDFNVTYQYSETTGTSYFGAAKSTALSELFTAAAGFVVDSVTSTAMQDAIWEVIYETSGSYDLTSGVVTVTPGDPGQATAFNTVNGFLHNLSSYSAGYSISVLTNPTVQDLIFATPVPEPGTWALLAAGLGVVGLMARRRKR